MAASNVQTQMLSFLKVGSYDVTSSTVVPIGAFAIISSCFVVNSLLGVALGAMSSRMTYANGILVVPKQLQK